MAQVQSAVRLPTPPPIEATPALVGKRKRSISSRSPSPNRRRSSPHASRANGERTDDGETKFRGRGFGIRPKDTSPTKELTEEEKLAAAKAEFDKLLNSRAGGVYVPPARLKALEAQLMQDKTTKEYQRIVWEALKKSIQGLVNKATAANIKLIVPELFGENLIRGKGLFCRSIMRAQSASLPFTPVYSAMVAIVNTKLPEIGELLLHRLVNQFKKAFRRNDKQVCLASTTFLGGLFNQGVVHEILIAEILLLLLQKPTDDSVELAVGLMKEAGERLSELNGQISMLCFDQFRTILNEHDLDKRVQYMVEVLFAIRKDKWKNHEAIKEELDLVEEDDQVTHTEIHLDQDHETKDSLNIFKFDPEFEENEQAYSALKREILGEDDDEGSDDSGSYESGSESEEEKKMEIQDQSNAQLVELRKKIYLTIQSSADYEECVHKLMRVNIPDGLEPELPSMIVECCSQIVTYTKFYGLIAERLARLNRLWKDLFEEAFVTYYETIHRYETNRLRNIAKLFGHLLGSEALGWHVLSAIHLNEEETTSSSRIYIKILFQDLQENLGMPKLIERLQNDPMMQESLVGIFPVENPRNISFSINYFTSIGMGALTDQMRERLKTIAKTAAPALPATRREDSVSDTDSYSSYTSYTGSSRSYSRSRSPPRRGGDRRELPDRREPPGRGEASGRDERRKRSSSSRSYSSNRGRTLSRSPPRRKRRNDTPSTASPSRSRSRSPPRRSQPGGAPRRRPRSPSYDSEASRSRTPPRRRRDSPSVSRSPPRKRRD